MKVDNNLNRNKMNFSARLVMSKALQRELELGNPEMISLRKHFKMATNTGDKEFDKSFYRLKTVNGTIIFTNAVDYIFAAIVPDSKKGRYLVQPDKFAPWGCLYKKEPNDILKRLIIHFNELKETLQKPFTIVE